jgi:hypothetical protein
VHWRLRFIEYSDRRAENYNIKVGIDSYYNEVSFDLLNFWNVNSGVGLAQ